MMFKSDYIRALDDYKKARRRAEIQELLARLTGNPRDLELLSYEEVRHQLQAIEKSTEHLAEIPLDAIIGSVGRYHDFTRSFLPKESISQNRWARVMADTKGLSGLPPIEVYKIGDVYFVKDGNHRVSVARQMGNPFIQAYITEVKTRVNLSQDIKPDDLIIKAEYVLFLEKTRLDQIKPEINLSVTRPGAYPTLLQHIEVHRYYMGIEQQQEIPFPEASGEWYRDIYLPVVNIIRNRGMLRDFPDRTATDLYLWVADHRAALEKEVGWDIGPEAALVDLSEKHSPIKRRSITVLLSKLTKVLIPDIFEGGPPPGTWRKRLFKMTVLEHLFSDLIVALDDSQNAWNALDQAILIAKMEKSRIHGIHVHPQVTETIPEEHEQTKREFENRCRDAGTSGYNFLISEGEIGKVLCEHARFADLIILPLNHPPGEKPISRLGSGLSTLIRSCPIPILTVPAGPTRLNKILLAYDGSLKAKEAMYIAAYFGSQRQVSLKILTSSVGIEDPSKSQNEAKAYLSLYPIKAEYIITDSTIPQEIEQLIQHDQIDLILIGGYRGASIIDFVLGSVVDQVLREIQIPILICR